MPSGSLPAQTQNDIPRRGTRYAGGVRVLVSVALLGALVGIGVLLGGCSGKPEPPAPTATSDAPVIPDAPVGSNAQDAAFGAGLLGLQQQAIELAGLAQRHSSNPELLGLATAIATGQQGERDTIKVLMVQWSDGSGPPAAPNTAAPGALDPAVLTRLESLQGPEFDTLWLQSMTGLHRGVIGLAEAEIGGGHNADARTLAKSILDTRQAQLQQMQQMVG